MKKLTLGCLFILITGFALLWWSETRDSRKRQENILEALAEIEQEKNQEFNTSANSPSSEPKVLQNQPIRLPAAPENAAPKPLRRLMQDPEMRENLRQEAAANVERTARSFLAAEGLTNIFQMNEAQQNYMHALLTNKLSVHWRFLDGAMAGEIRPDNVKEEAAKIRGEMDLADRQIKDFLGEDNFKVYKDFEHSYADREKVKQIARDLLAEGAPIGSEQSQQLTQIYSEERKSYPWRVNFEEGNGFDFEHFFANTSEARSEIYFQDMEGMNSRILERIQPLLTPSQFSAFAEMQKRDFSRSKFVFKSTTALMNASR